MRGLSVGKWSWDGLGRNVVSLKVLLGLSRFQLRDLCASQVTLVEQEHNFQCAVWAFGLDSPGLFPPSDPRKQLQLAESCLLHGDTRDLYELPRERCHEAASAQIRGRGGDTHNEPWT